LPKLFTTKDGVTIPADQVRDHIARGPSLDLPPKHGFRKIHDASTELINTLSKPSKSGIHLFIWQDPTSDLLS
jgi:hypothetical protein